MFNSIKSGIRVAGLLSIGFASSSFMAADASAYLSGTPMFRACVGKYATANLQSSIFGRMSPIEAIDRAAFHCYFLW